MEDLERGIDIRSKMDPNQEEPELIEALKRNEGDVDATFQELAVQGLESEDNRRRIARLIHEYERLKQKPTLH